MKRALKCTGYVIMGIAIVSAVLGGATAVALILFILSDWTALAFGFSKQAASLFLLGYLAIGGGAFVGVCVCKDAS